MCLLGKTLFVPKRRRSDEGLCHWTPSPSAGAVLTDVTGWRKEGAWNHRNPGLQSWAEPPGMTIDAVTESRAEPERGTDSGHT